MSVLLGPILEIGKELIDRLVPDKNKRFEAQKELEKIILEKRQSLIDAAKASDEGQTAINVEEAKSENLFKSGWRPALGWVCVVALFVTYFAYPLAQWLSPIYGFPIPPKPDFAELFTLLTGMLGLGTLRTIEKVQG